MLNLNYNVIGSQRDKTVRGRGIPFQDFLVEVLAIAGGGRGGTDTGGGGGGAGGYKYKANYYISSSGFYTVAIGAGQPSWQDTGGVCTADPGFGTSLSGSNTFVYNSIDGSNFYTMGGGAASCGGTLFNPTFPGSNGGSGGGGRAFGGSGGSGFTDVDLFVQGFAGGAAAASPGSNGGGGGGAGAVGNYTDQGAGGIGRLDLTLPAPLYRAGGGTGGSPTAVSASAGGGGYFSTSSLHSIMDGQANTGGGGGCGQLTDGGRGGSGFVQFRYPGAQRALGGQIYEEKNVFGDVLFTVHSFTASGVFQPII